MRPLFFFFPLTISFSPPLYTLFFFFLRTTSFLLLFWFSFSASTPSPCCTLPRGSLQPVSTGPPPPPGKRRKLFCGHLIAAVRRLSVGVSAPLLSHHHQSRRHLYTHTHTEREIHGRNSKGGKELCGPLCRSHPAFHGVGGNGGESRVLLCIALDQEALVLCFPRTTMPCTLPPFPQSPTLFGQACFLPVGRKTRMVDDRFRSR